jgi:hypothetical protein
MKQILLRVHYQVSGGRLQVAGGRLQVADKKLKIWNLEPATCNLN